MSVWKEGSIFNGCNKDVRDAISEQAKLIQLKGLELQAWVEKDLFGVVAGFPNYEFYDEKTLGRGGNKIKSSVLYERLLQNGSWPDIDSVIIHSETMEPIMVVSSKASLNDDHMYSTILHGLWFQEKNIKFIVITKDTKGIFKTGETKYLKHVKKHDFVIYVNNHNNYDDPKQVHNWGEYSFCDNIKPYFQCSNDIFNIITCHTKDNGHKLHKYFDFTKK